MLRLYLNKVDINIRIWQVFVKRIGSDTSNIFKKKYEEVDEVDEVDEVGDNVIRCTPRQAGPFMVGTLSIQTVPVLCKALPRTDSDTAMVILKALNCIGDGRAINAVERLTHKPPTDEIGRFAAELLPILRLREIDGRSSAQLLRASSSPEYGKQELLRGVGAANACDSDVLVRVATGVTEESR